MKQKIAQGFTLLEILLVVAAIAILAGIVIVAINPGKQLADTRNAERRLDTKTILNAVYQYSIDNKGSFPASLPTSDTEICKTGGSCSGYVDLSALVPAYITAMPVDPSVTSSSGTGYSILLNNSTNRITVSSLHAERGLTISATN